MTKSPILLLALLLPVQAQPGAEGEGAGADPAGYSTGIAARVNRDVITEREVWRTAGVAPETLSPADRERQLEIQLVRMIENRLEQQEVRRIGLALNDDILEQEVEREKDGIGRGEAYRQYLLERGMTDEEFRRDVAFRTKSRYFLGGRSGAYETGEFLRSEHVIEPTLEEVREAYLARRDDEFTQEERVRVRAIALSLRRLEAEHGSREAALAFAEKLVEDLRTGADFNLLANRHSAFEASREEKQGGEFGWLTPDDQVNEVLREKAFSDEVPVGEVVGPDEQGAFLWIVEVLEREAARTLQFEEVALGIRRVLRERRVQRAILEVKLEIAREAFISPPKLKQLHILRLRQRLADLAR